jgi:hypothetical protein
MSQNERFGFRDAAYSLWHRAASSKRFVGVEKAQTLAMIDIDVMPWVEAEEGAFEPLALIETAVDNNQPGKCGSILANVARRANLPCYTVLYRVTQDLNPAYPQVPDIVEFRVRRLWPLPATPWVSMTPERYCRGLLNMRQRECRKLDELAGFDSFLEDP